MDKTNKVSRAMVRRINRKEKMTTLAEINSRS